MAKTYAQLSNLISQILQDTDKTTFPMFELDAFMSEALTFVSRFRPHQKKETLTTTLSSKDLTLSAENRRKLLWLDALEYKVDQNPKQFRNFTKWADIISMDINFLPSAGENVYLYLAKKHILQKEIGTNDPVGAIKTQAAAGANSLVLKDLGNGIINEDTQLTIAGDSTIYIVIATATIVANEATVTIIPVLTALVAANAVVTLSLAPSTMDDALEEAYCDYVAAITTISKAGALLSEGHNTIAVLATINTAIENMSARITQAITDIGSGRTEVAKTIGLVTSSAIALSKVDAEVAQALADLDTGRSLITSFNPLGDSAAEYARYASGDIQNARGYLDEATGYMRQASADESIGGSYGALAVRELNAATSSLNQAGGYIQKISAGLRIAQTARLYREEGERRLALALRKLESLVEPRVAQILPRS